MFKYAVDLFKKLKICIIPCIIAFVGIVGYCAKQIFTNINTTEVLYGERVVLEFSVVLFIFPEPESISAILPLFAPVNIF